MSKTFDAIVNAADTAMRVYMRLRSRIARPAVAETTFGFRMQCDTRDYIQRRVYHFGIYEPNLSYYLLERVRPGDHVLDIGANVGYITLLMSSAVGPSGKVVAIEASPTTYAALLRNLELNQVRNVVALNAAATSGACRMEIVEGEQYNSGSNSVRPSSGAGAVTVRGDALANFAEIDRARITFMKIDVEETEGPILEHILQTLDAFTSLRTIAVEIAPQSGDYVARFSAAGFRVYGLPNNYRIGYLLVRHYLRQSDEAGFVVKIPVDAYEPRFRDFVFERSV